MTIGIAQQRVAYQVTLRLRHNFLLAGENAMLARMPLENLSFFSTQLEFLLKMNNFRCLFKGLIEIFAASGLTFIETKIL